MTVRFGLVGDLSQWRHLLLDGDTETIVRSAAALTAIIALLWLAAIILDSDFTRRHGRGLTATLLLAISSGGLLVTIWTPELGRALGTFVTSPGLAALAALSAAGVALHGVSRQIAAQQNAQNLRSEEWRQEKFWDFYQWLSDNYVRTGESLDAFDITLVGLETLVIRARTSDEQAAATELAQLVSDRLQEMET